MTGIDVTCPHCGSAGGWRLGHVNVGRIVGVLRVRIYHCRACPARLYTHENLGHFAPPGLVPQGTAIKGRRARFDETTCPGCRRSNWIHATAYASGTVDPVRYFVYRCAHCAWQLHTAEHLKGVTEGPTPREERSHRPHPHL